MPTLAPPADPVLAGRTWPQEFPPVHVRGVALRPVPQDVSVARRFAREYCSWRGISGSIADDVALCTSEVFGNLRHAFFPQGRTRAFVQIRQHGPFVSVRVFDPDWQHLPVVAASPELGAESGRGLSSIVAALACRLEFGPAPHRLKRVEFTINCLPSKTS